MRKLSDLSPEMLKRLEGIGQAIAKNQSKDPDRFTYGCPPCEDTGYIVRDVYHYRHNRKYAVGSACLDCDAGLRISERIHREREEKAAAPKGAGELRRLAVVKRQKEIEGMEIDSSQDDLPF